MKSEESKFKAEEIKVKTEETKVKTEETKVKTEERKIKLEAKDEGPLAKTPPISPLMEVDELSDGEISEDDGIVEDEEGTEYYVDAGFRILQVPQAEIWQHHISNIATLLRAGALKLDPEYQRDAVWDEHRSSGLIQSMLQGYFIPPIIFNLIAAPADSPIKVIRICVDGKQRLTSVMKFVNGHIGVMDCSNPPKKWYFCHPTVGNVVTQSNHHILPESTKKFFMSRKFCCYEYSNLPSVVEENMFQLVQRGIPLTPAERMRALSTVWAKFAKQYEEDYERVVDVSKHTRASGFKAVSTIFCQILEVTGRESNRSSPTLQAAPSTVSRLLLDERSLNEGVKAKLKEVFDKFQKVVDFSSQKVAGSKKAYKISPNSAFDPAPDYLQAPKVSHVKTFSPLEQLATAILILVHGRSRSVETLAEDIKVMRVYLREVHKDLRINNLCWISVWKFISTKVCDRGGSRAETSGDASSARATRSTTTADSSATGTATQVNDRSKENPPLTARTTALVNGLPKQGSSSTGGAYPAATASLKENNELPAREVPDKSILTSSSVVANTAILINTDKQDQDVSRSTPDGNQLLGHSTPARQSDAESEAGGPTSRMPKASNSIHETGVSRGRSPASLARHSNTISEDGGHPEQLPKTHEFIQETGIFTAGRRDASLRHKRTSLPGPNRETRKSPRADNKRRRIL